MALVAQPFDYTRHTTGKWDDWFLSQYPNYPCIPIPPDEEICCGFDDLDPTLPPTSPVSCRDHPELRFGWDLPASPSVTEVGDHRMLCFEEGDQAGVLIGRDVKSARIYLAMPRGRDTEVGPRKDCVDFSRHVPGREPNGSTQDGFTFTVFDAAGGRPNDLFFRPIGAAANIVGLFTDTRCVIVLPFGSDTAHLDLWIGAGQPIVMAYGADGTALTSVTAYGRGLQGIDLTASEPIETVVIQADRSEVSLVNICATSASSAGAGVLVYGQDHAGEEFGPFPVTGGVAELPGNDLRMIIVRGRGPILRARLLRHRRPRQRRTRRSSADGRPSARRGRALEPGRIRTRPSYRLPAARRHHHPRVGLGIRIEHAVQQSGASADRIRLFPHRGGRPVWRISACR